MTVIQTDKWLERDFSKPEDLCRNLQKNFGDQLSSEEIYRILSEKGMYHPNRRTAKIFMDLKENQVWNQISHLEVLYQKKWNGPDVPIYIFPVQHSPNPFRVMHTGYTYPDKIFLFLNITHNKKDIEALFIHEYHHATRLNKMKKPIEEHTLLDSIIMEGLAEHAVLNCCGEKSLSPWTRRYEERLLKTYWEKEYLPHLNVKISEKEHHRLLFGKDRVKPMLGYAMGFYIVSQYCKKYNCNIQKLLSLPAENFINKH